MNCHQQRTKGERKWEFKGELQLIAGSIDQNNAKSKIYEKLIVSFYWD